MTPLARLIAETVAAEGPMPVDRYMSLCLGHPQHGYYMTRDPLGAGGDFTTSPEISQVFGELIGVWCASVWSDMGAPSHVALVELGPGRGTLMADILRVLAKLPQLAKAVQVHFVETSPALRDEQFKRVPNAIWHDSIASLPALPTLLVANEFFDALPIRQFVREHGQVFERCIGVKDGVLEMGLVPSAFRFPLKGEGVFEDGLVRNTIATHLGNHLRQLGGAALVIDYGHAEIALGDTLQAMKHHAYCAVTDHAGEADITSHVDFGQLALGFKQGGASIAGLMTQGDFLQAMGLAQRTEVLARTLDGEPRQQFLAASERLAHHEQMGHLFKVMAVTGKPELKPYPFGAE